LDGKKKSTRWSVWQPCFRGRDMTLRTPPAASKVHRNNETTKDKKDDTTKPNFDPSCEELRVSSSLQGSTLPKMGLPRATAFRFGQSHSEAIFNFYFNSRRDQKRAREIHTLRVATPFFKSSPETMSQQIKTRTNTEQTDTHTQTRPKTKTDVARLEYAKPKWLFVLLFLCFAIPILR